MPQKRFVLAFCLDSSRNCILLGGNGRKIVGVCIASSDSRSNAGRSNAFGVMSALWADGRADGRTGAATITFKKLHSRSDACSNAGRLDSSNEGFYSLSDGSERIYLHLVRAVFTFWDFKTAHSATHSVKVGGIEKNTAKTV